MTDAKSDFGSLFKNLRLKSGLTTLSQFGDALTHEGLVYENSLFSHWQKGDRIPRDRKILLTIIGVFIKRGGISTFEDVNLFLASSGQGYLTDDENQGIINLFEEKKERSGDELNIFIEDIKSTNNIADYLMEQSNLAYEKIYEGYPHIVG